MAQRQKTLQRNFQGYSTRGGADIYAFGMSSISQAEGFYWQNHKELPAYYGALDAGKLPLHRGYVMTEEDKLRRTTIMRLMCDLGLDYEAMSKLLGLDFKEHFARELDSLDDMEADGLLVKTPQGLIVTDLGRLLIRNIAMRFDAYAGDAEGEPVLADDMRSVAIIGAGITGLTAAFYLKRKGVPVTVYEASDRVGGAIQSIRAEGYLAEFGPNTILETSPKVAQLVIDAGLASRRLDPDPKAERALRGALPAAHRDAGLAAGLLHHQALHRAGQAGRAARAVRAAAPRWQGGERRRVRGAPPRAGVSGPRH